MQRSSTVQVLLLGFLYACSGTGSTLELEQDALADHTGAMDQVSETSHPVEVTVPDQSFGSDTDGELTFPDAALPDATGPECAPGEGCFLDKCTENTQCQSGWCVEHMGEGVCTQQCQEECPQGWGCKPVGAGGPDLVYVCVSDFANLCKPCASTGDCESPGGAQDVCVSYDGQGSFCGGVCALDDDCPWGFACVDATTVDGIELKQCRAEAGVCPCASKSVELALWTPCVQANEFGSCSGKRICTASGLTACDAGQPAQESCNGLDDDCDGEVDEPMAAGGDYINLCDDQNECTQDTCTGEAGCTYQPLNEGECKDGDSCTVGDHCTGGECVGNPVVCDDSNPCTDDSCNGLGGCLFAPNADDCDDNDPCTVADECSQGECAGVAINCDCQQDADCQGLEDGNLCNGTLYCDLSTLPYQCEIVPDSPVNCPEPSGPNAICQAAVCNPDSGTCSTVPAHEGFACDAGNPCTVGDHCEEGTCVSGVAIGCNDQNPCTDDTCSESEGCVNVPVAGDCDDGNACTLSDHCTDGVCGSAMLLNCDDENPCTTDFCDPATGCTHKLNNAPCDDGDICTTGDHCHLGSCISSGLLTCDDNNPCTSDSCQVDSGCQFKPVAGACDDGNPCTEGDHCANGWCTFTAFKECSDGFVCNGVEICQPDSGCQDGVPPVLSDANACTLDFCDEAQGGVVHTPIHEECDNGSWCDGLESCDANLGCVAGVPPMLGDDIACTADLCDEATDSVKHLPDYSLCVDNDKCNGTESCHVLSGCVAGTPLDCDDQLACTVDGCDPGTGCTHVPQDPLCDDGTTCTTDTCSPEVGCLFVPVADGTNCEVNGLAGGCDAGVCIPDCQPGSQTFSSTGGPQTFALPICATNVTIEAFGAQGGNEESGKGGFGARMKCRLQGIAGKTLEIRVGEAGKVGIQSLAGGGGGGGSFAWVAGANSPLAIAGGGGGASYQGDNGQPGLTTNQGGPGGYYAVPAGSGGFSDGGGGGGTGAGGGGWNSGGTGNIWTTPGAAKGGAGGTSKDYTGHGGYGGGGGAYHGGGGGGGYSGGSGGTYTKGAGGGGSYCAGDSLEAAAGANSGNGKIIISWD